VVSIINRASVQELEDRLGQPVDPLRFRGNLIVSGWPAWSEFDRVGQEIVTTSGVVLRGIKRIERCAATNVDPVTGARDMMVPRALMEFYGHADCGLYAEVVSGGTVARGDGVEG
jgi:uncharacterized protein YcbX